MPSGKSQGSNRKSQASHSRAHAAPGGRSPSDETSAEGGEMIDGSNAECTTPHNSRPTQGKRKAQLHAAPRSVRKTLQVAAPSALMYSGNWSEGCGLDTSGKEHVKHAFLQVLMHHQVLRQDTPQEEEDFTALSVFQEISGNTTGSVAALVDLIADINKNVKFLELEIRRMLFPAERVWYVALVNTLEDAPSKLLVAPIKDGPHDLYNHAELTFFKALVESIATSRESVQAGVPVLSLMEALHLDDSGFSQAGPSQVTQSTGKPLTMYERQQVLSRLTRDKWLARSPDGRGGIIGPRTFMALRSWVQSLDVSQATREEWDRTL